MSNCITRNSNHGAKRGDCVTLQLIGVDWCQGAVCFGPAADGDLIHGVVAMTERNCGILGVVLAMEVDSHMCGSHKLLQGDTVVEVVVARSQVRLRCQHAEGDISMGERYVADEKDRQIKKLASNVISRPEKVMKNSIKNIILGGYAKLYIRWP